MEYKSQKVSTPNKICTRVPGNGCFQDYGHMRCVFSVPKNDTKPH